MRKKSEPATRAAAPTDGESGRLEANRRVSSGCLPGRVAVRRAWLAGIVVIVLACAPSAGPAGDEQDAPPAQRQTELIDHVMPARDSVGKAPTRFEWTKVDGADRYAIGVWNEVDVLLWRQDDIQTNAIDRPEPVQFEPGTYFWSVSALKDGRQIGESGLSAFVVRE